MEYYKPEIPTGVGYVPIETSATQTLVVGVAGRRIVVLSCSVVCNVNVNVKFQTSTGGIDLTGPYYCIANGGFVLPYNQGGWFQTLVGDSLIINLSPSGAIGGCLSYVFA